MGASIGCAFGALAALALAPQSEAKTRVLVAERAGTFAEDAQDFGAGLGYYAQGAARDARKKGEEVIKSFGNPVEPESAVEPNAEDASANEEQIESEL